MKKVCALFASLLFISWPIMTHAYTQILISEIMYDVKGADTGREWIEVYNAGGTSIDFSQWKLAEGETNHVIKEAKGDTIFSPDTYAVIADNPNKFLIDHPDYPGVLFDSTFSLSNDGETLVLKDSTLNAVHEVTYAKDVGAAGDGNSLQKIDGVWYIVAPTPGEINSLVTTSSAASQTVEIQQEDSIVVQGDLMEGETITFIPEIGDTIDKVIWNFGDGITTERNGGDGVEHMYSFAGTYTVIANYGDGMAQVFVTIAKKPTLAEAIEIMQENALMTEVAASGEPERTKAEQDTSSIEEPLQNESLAAAAANAYSMPVYPWLLGLGGLMILAVIAVRLIRKPESSQVVVQDDGIEIID